MTSFVIVILIMICLSTTAFVTWWTVCIVRSAVALITLFAEGVVK